MVLLLSAFSRRLSADVAALQRELSCPVLVQEAPPVIRGGDEDDDRFTTTRVGMRHEPASGDPLVYTVHKGTSRNNAFIMGITVGRTVNNDIALLDPSVSRFHAYFQQAPKSLEWTLVDVGSSNGTWVAGQQLTANLPVPIPDRAVLKFGSVEVNFFQPVSFMAYLRARKAGR